MRKFIKYIRWKIISVISMVNMKLSKKLLYYQSRRKKLDLKNPITLDEKIHYINLYDKNPLYKICADKYEVREYIIGKGYENILNDLIFVSDNVSYLDKVKFPDRFALKCTHGAGYNIICPNVEKFDLKDSKKKISRWMKENYGLKKAEAHYIKIKPRIICEKYLGNTEKNFPIDYKIFCFNGRAEIISPRTNRDDNLRIFFLDKKWNDLNMYKQTDAMELPEKPKSLEKMIEIAEDLAKPFYFVRVDLYELEEKIIFGELTFTPSGGRTKYFTEEVQVKLGNMINIDNLIIKKN